MCSAIWGLRPPTKAQLDELFDEDMLGDDLEAWMDERPCCARTFRNVAVIAGLIERRLPGEEKSGRQVTFSSDLIYDVLRKHEPDHVLLRATRQDAALALADIRRLADLLVAPRAASSIAGSTASRRSPCRCCSRSARSACSTAPPRTSCSTYRRAGTDRRGDAPGVVSSRE